MSRGNLVSAGLLMYRRSAGGLEVFLVHPGGPYFARKDEGAWTVPKGEPRPGEDLLAAALREFEEETGVAPASAGNLDELRELGSVVQRGGKVVHAWAFPGDWPAGRPLDGNEAEIEWPPRSGRRLSFPEIDRAEFFDLEQARRKINPAQVALLDRLAIG